MSDIKNIKDELNEFAPDLLRMDKQESYQVPPRYFDRLGDEVLQRIKAEEAQAKQQVSSSWWESLVSALQNLLQPKLAIGLAAIALLFIGIQQFMPGSENAEEVSAFASLTDAEFENYLAENIADFEDELLEGLVSELDYIPETIGDEELDNYFQDINEDFEETNIDIEELLL
jgi:hypothetical protein